MALRKRQIEMGTRFVKVDEPNTIWVVNGKGSDRTPVPHYVLIREDAHTRQRTLSEAVLLDRNYYRQV